MTVVFNSKIMHTNLIEHIKKNVALTDAEKDLISTYFKHQSIKKKAIILKEGQICQHYYFISKGCFRFYIINQKGTEQTLQFGIEDWWLTDYRGFETQQPSNFYIQAIENSEVLSITKNDFDELLEKVPRIEKYFRIVMQKAFGAAQMRIKFLFTMTAEERYHHFNNQQPHFVQRVPQYMLASYLDFSPEFMSKIRAGKGSS